MDKIHKLRVPNDVHNCTPESTLHQSYNQQLDTGHPTVHLNTLQVLQAVGELPF